MTSSAIHAMVKVTIAQETLLGEKNVNKISKIRFNVMEYSFVWLGRIRTSFTTPN